LAGHKIKMQVASFIAGLFLGLIIISIV